MKMWFRHSLSVSFSATLHLLSQDNLTCFIVIHKKLFDSPGDEPADVQFVLTGYLPQPLNYIRAEINRCGCHFEMILPHYLRIRYNILELEVLMETDAVLEYMVKERIPLTRKRYLNIAFFGNPPKKLSAEQIFDLPEIFWPKKYRSED